jgi:hypothetical protein
MIRFGNRYACRDGEGKARALLKGFISKFWSIKMGKYFLGWLLGVPTIVLVILYLLFH